MLHEVQRREPCDDSLLTLGSLGIGKKTPAGAKVWECAQPRAKILLKGDTTLLKLMASSGIVNQKDQQSFLSPADKY